MKVIVPGKPPEPKQPWWVGKIATCLSCGCQVILEREDHIWVVGKADRIWAEGVCPTVGCFKNVKTESAQRET